MKVTHHRLSRSLPLLAALSSSMAVAQGATAARPDPLDARAAVTPLVHRSALSDYRGGASAPALGWREANANVERIGGWRAYAREANAPQAATPWASAPAAAPPARAPATTTPDASPAPAPAASAPERATRPAPPHGTHRQ
jgi:hypothetical protein